ncbi:MAG TPA: winged helix-turn-helix domain-containing protein [Steroidobacteraceae bacterium]|nr:winged helix-turn-helix domain-containing protein [Steroidobacteraceae bacterium]
MSETSKTPEVHRFGVFEVDMQSRELRKQGRRVRLQEQSFHILSSLLQRPGEVVTREQLREQLWPSSVYVDFDHGLNNAIARLRRALGDDAATPRFIETLPRLGYRFIYPVDSAAAPVQPARWWQRPWAVASMSVVALMVAAPAAWLMRPAVDRPAAAQPQLPALAVLPFTSLSPPGEDQQFADGLTEELTAQLAGISGLRVVARTSAQRFKDKHESAAAIADALQVGYLLEGSVRRSGEHLRITAQLIDARKDEHLWSQIFERDLGDIFRIQEDISFAVASALQIELLASDQSRIRARGTTDPEAHRLFVIAQAHLLGRTKGADPALAKRLLESAIERDPHYARAHAGLARYYFRRAWGTLTEIEESSLLGTAAAERAFALDPSSSEALQARASFAFWRSRFQDDYEAHLAGESDMQRAIGMDPASSLAFEEFGRAIFWNEPDMASSLFERAIEVDALCAAPHVLIASALGNRGQLEAARRRCTDLIARYPDAFGCHMAIATLETYFGELVEAATHLRAIEKRIGGAARVQLWSVHMSLGDRSGAEQWLDFGKNPFEAHLAAAARLAMDGRHDAAFELLAQHRKEYPISRLLDLPAAKFALIANEPHEALQILTERLPYLARGMEPITARNVMPALDLATAQLRTGAVKESRALLDRVAAYLDGPAALQLPLFTFQRARAHALAGEHEAALRALDRAYQQGFRTTWALDLRPQSLLYMDPIEAEPAFQSLRGDARLTRWFERLRADNAAQLARLK